MNIDEIKEYLKANEFLIIENFGRFEKRVLRKRKLMRNSKTKQLEKVEEKLSIRFTPSRLYLKEINNGDTRN